MKVGDKYRGMINNKIFEIIEIKDNYVYYECDNEKYCYGLDAFKHCYLEKIH